MKTLADVLITLFLVLLVWVAVAYADHRPSIMLESSERSVICQFVTSDDLTRPPPYARGQTFAEITCEAYWQAISEAAVRYGSHIPWNCWYADPCSWHVSLKEGAE